MLLQDWRDCRGPTGNETISRPPWGGLARTIRVHSSASALKGGLRPTLHSDWNVIAIGPLRMVENAVTRTMHHGGDVLNTAEKAPVEATLRMVTADAAWQCRQDFTAVIMAGKAADLVILDKDPMRVDPSTIRDIAVRETWLDASFAFRLNVVATACRPANRISIDVRFWPWLCENVLAEALALPMEQCELPTGAALQRELAGGDYALNAAMSG